MTGTSPVMTIEEGNAVRAKSSIVIARSNATKQSMAALQRNGRHGIASLRSQRRREPWRLRFAQ
jgi:hypothetical protein